MNDELTEVDIRKMQEEIDYRISLRPQLRADVQQARELGDLSENDEYRTAKREKGKNDSRIRYLQNMIATAKIIRADSRADEVGLFDKVTLYIEEDEATETYRLVTTLRENVLEGCVSKESPLGKALMGKRVGDRVCISPSPSYSYYAQIRAIEKGEDDPSLPITSY
ncbi:MAG: GreA/GreB family elongation factor [Clostridia bacterium]|nr:GreA/GreB family elongation factor [Clostridia bacterium]